MYDYTKEHKMKEEDFLHQICSFFSLRGINVVFSINSRRADIKEFLSICDETITVCFRKNYIIFFKENHINMRKDHIYTYFTDDEDKIINGVSDQLQRLNQIKVCYSEFEDPWTFVDLGNLNQAYKSFVSFHYPIEYLK